MAKRPNRPKPPEPFDHGRCPICKNDFKDQEGCPHSIKQVNAFLQARYDDAVIDWAVAQVMKPLVERIERLEQHSHPPQEVVSGREFDVFKDEITHRLDVLEGQDD